MTKVHYGEKTSEKSFVMEVRRFLSSQGYIKEAECHFDGDSAELADVELALEGAVWPADMPRHLVLEAKSHHSEDAPNTINKAFGQLLKEANKATGKRAQRDHCLGLLIPVDGATWRKKKGMGDLITAKSGIEYYRDGFQRIDSEVFAGFGRLVNAGYVLAFSVYWRYMDVFEWNGFRAGHPALVRLETRA
jgi:hypothetical protein